VSSSLLKMTSKDLSLQLSGQHYARWCFRKESKPDELNQPSY
jgi:hypothetical protein